MGTTDGLYVLKENITLALAGVRTMYFLAPSPLTVPTTLLRILLNNQREDKDSFPKHSR